MERLKWRREKSIQCKERNKVEQKTVKEWRV